MNHKNMLWYVFGAMFGILFGASAWIGNWSRLDPRTGVLLGLALILLDLPTQFKSTRQTWFEMTPLSVMLFVLKYVSRMMRRKVAERFFSEWMVREKSSAAIWTRLYTGSDPLPVFLRTAIRGVGWGFLVAFRFI